MKPFLSILIVLLFVFVAAVAYVADQMFGVVAFGSLYSIFCILAALALGGIWHASFKKSGPVFGCVVFGVLMANFLLPPPSERHLRSVMLQAPPGTDASAIVHLVKQQYGNSPYEMPLITEDRSGNVDRIHVSLLSQKARNCTAAIFLIENGRVSQSLFSAD